MKRAHGPRQNTRKKLKKRARDRGKISTTKLLQKFKPGEKVVLKPEPAVQKSIPFRRFIGRRGIISGERGGSYIVSIKDGGKEKKIICRPIHLKRV